MANAPGTTNTSTTTSATARHGRSLPDRSSAAVPIARRSATAETLLRLGDLLLELGAVGVELRTLLQRPERLVEAPDRAVHLADRAPRVSGHERQRLDRLRLVQQLVGEIGPV